jgi:hypothetical protein
MPLTNHNIDFEKLISQLLGNLHRRPKRIAWLKALSKPFETIHERFLLFTDEKLEELKYNSQTFVMEKMLQHYFGGGIYITNNLGSYDGMTIGEGSDWSSGIGAGSDFDCGIGETFSATPFDFTVNVPAAIVFVQSEMEAKIRKYKLFGTTFNIVIF